MPEEVGNLPDIQLLRMKNNKVRELGVNWLKLEQIKVIDLMKNCLGGLPQELAQCRTLVELNVAENMIEYCPSLAQIDTL